MSTIILNPFEIFAGIPRNGLVFEYLFSNNYLDTSGNAYNGINNGSTPIADRHSAANSAIDFDGSSYVDIDAAVAGLLTNTKGCLSYWVKPTTSTPSLQEFPISFSNDVLLNEGIHNSMLASSGILRTQYVTIPTPPWRLNTDANPFTSGVWTHVLNNFDGIENKIYIDGSFVAQTFSAFINKTLWFADLINFNTGRIGDRKITNSEVNHYIGGFDDYRGYNRNLTVSEITALANE